MDVKTLSGILGHTRAAFTLDTYTHTTGDMQKRAAEIVDEFLTDIFGEELKPWQKKRKNREGTVRLRKDGRWEGRVVIGYDDQGLPKTKNVLAKTKSECVEKLKTLKDALAPPAPPRIKADMPFGDWMEHWYETYSRPAARPGTRRIYEGYLRLYIRPGLGHIPLNRLTAKDMQRFFAWLKAEGRADQSDGETGLADSQLRNIHSLCWRALEKAVSGNLIPQNPASGCKLPPARKGEMNLLSRESMQKLLIQAKEEKYYELFLLEFATGLRLGELTALQWEDLNLTTGELRISKQAVVIGSEVVVTEPKTKAAVRTLLLPPKVLEVFREYRKRNVSRWLFPSPKKEDSPLLPSVVRQRLHRLLDYAGCERVRFHDLRHPYVKHTTKIFSLRLMNFQAQAYPDARRKTRGACQLHRGGQSKSLVRLLCNRKQFSCLPPQSKISRILYAISIRLSGYTSTRSISSSASSVVSVSASKSALDASLRLSCRACSSCFCFACANTAA